MEEETIKQKSFPTSLLILVAVIIIIVLVFILANRTQNTDKDIAKGQGTELEMSNDQINFEGIPAFDWEGHRTATQNIQILDKNQFINDNVIIDPTDENTVYFATFAPCCGHDSHSGDSQVGIYRYHMNNHNFERLFRATYGAGDFPFLGEGEQKFHLLGYDNKNLIVLAMNFHTQLDNCAEKLLLGTESRGDEFNLLSISINDPYAGFEEYTPPEQIMETVRSRQNECLNQ